MEQLFANKTLDANQAIRHKKVQDALADTHQSSEAIDIGRAAFKTTLNIIICMCVYIIIGSFVLLI